MSLKIPSQGFGDRTCDLLGHPYALARTALKQELERMHLASISGRVLDVGCGSMPYRHLFRNASSYHGLEIDQPRNWSNPNVTYWYDGRRFPLPDHSYAAVICSQVLEHSFQPEDLITEAFRVLAPGGMLILTIPFFWPEHEQPHDSQRFTSFGLTHLLQAAGFDDIYLQKVNPGLAAIIQLTIEWLESLQRNRFKGRAALLWRIFSFPPYCLMNLIGVTYRNLPPVSRWATSAELYLDLVVRAKKL